MQITEGCKMKNENLRNLVDYSICRIQKGERLALSLDSRGYWMAFSGGKDSQVLFDLVKRAGVKYHAVYNVTANDPPENVHFIKKYYPEVQFMQPKEGFFKLIEKKGLPTIIRRYCCERIKERVGEQCVVLAGIRKAESAKRSKYDETMIRSRRVENQGKRTTLEGIIDNEHRCIKGKDKIMLYPIFQWSEKDVWDYIKLHNLPVNPCYEVSVRVGCMFCPFTSKRELAYYEEKYPLYKKQIMKRVERFIALGKTQLTTAEDYYEWWKSKKTIKQYLDEKQQSNLFAD